MLPRRRHPISESENSLIESNERHLLPQTNLINRINTDRENYYIESNPIDYVESETTVMAARDRTNEFINTVHALQGDTTVGRLQSSSRDSTRQSKVFQNYSEFMYITKIVSRNISSTYTKLEQLTLLAKKKSLFDDHTREIQELTYIIKNDLNSLNQQIAQLQNISRNQKQHANGRKHLQSHSSNIVLTLQSKLATISTNFKQVLEVRTENLKQQKSRRDHFSQATANTTTTIGHSSLLFQEQDQQQIEPQQPKTSSSQNQIQASLMLSDQTDNYLQSRADTMQNIESTIVELGSIFQQLAHMVKEQEELVERIDTNVENTELNIEAAHTQILKYFKSVSSNRWLMIKIFAVLIFFFIFFIVFVA